MEENKFTEKDYLEAQYKIQRSIQTNVNIITFIMLTQFIFTIIGTIIVWSSLSSSLSAIPSILHK